MIHPYKCITVLDDDKVEFETSSKVKIYSSFDSMGLREDLLRGIYAYGMFLPCISTFMDLEETHPLTCCVTSLHFQFLQNLYSFYLVFSMSSCSKLQFSFGMRTHQL
jgi:hypothetical protein